MKINLFIRHLLASALIRDKEELGFIRCNFNDLIVFPHNSAKKMIDQNTGEIVVTTGDINVTGEYHFGFVNQDARDLMRILSNNTESLTYSMNESLEYFFGMDRVVSPSKLKAVQAMYDSSSAIKKNMKADTYIRLSPEISDVLMAKMQSELDNIVFHIDEKDSDNVDVLFNMMIKYADKFPALNYVYSDKMNVPEFLERMDAAKCEVMSLVQEDHMRTRLNRFMKASQESIDGIIMTTNSIGFSKKPYIEFRCSFNLLMWYLKLYPNIVTNQRLGTNFSVTSMSYFINRLMDSYAIADALTAILQRGFGVDMKGSDTISSLLKIMLRGVMNAGTFNDAAAELNDIFTDDFYLSTDNIVGSDDEGHLVKSITESLTMESFLSADVSMDLLPVYTQLYIAESVANDLSHEHSGNFISELLYKGKKYMIDRKHKKYQILLNDINKDIALAYSSSNEFKTVSQKHDLIRELHGIKKELIELADKGANLGDDDLLDIIEDRIEYIDTVVDKVNSRVVKDEKSIPITESAVGVLSEFYSGFAGRILESVADDLSKEDDPSSGGSLEKFLFRRKTYKINKSKKKYELLLNDINEEFSMIVSASKELTTLKQKNKLIKEVYALKGDLLKLKYKAHKVGFDDFEDVIEGRMNYADSLSDSINKRVIRKENGKVGNGPFHLEGDMADRL